MNEHTNDWLAILAEDEVMQATTIHCTKTGQPLYALTCDDLEARERIMGESRSEELLLLERGRAIAALWLRTDEHALTALRSADPVNFLSYTMGILLRDWACQQRNSLLGEFDRGSIEWHALYTETVLAPLNSWCSRLNAGEVHALIELMHDWQTAYRRPLPPRAVSKFLLPNKSKATLADAIVHVTYAGLHDWLTRLMLGIARQRVQAALADARDEEARKRAQERIEAINAKQWKSTASDDLTCLPNLRKRSAAKPALTEQDIENAFAIAMGMGAVEPKAQIATTATTASSAKDAKDATTESATTPTVWSFAATFAQWQGARAMQGGNSK